MHEEKPYRSDDVKIRPTVECTGTSYKGPKEPRIASVFETCRVLSSLQIGRVRVHLRCPPLRVGNIYQCLTNSPSYLIDLPRRRAADAQDGGERYALGANAIEEEITFPRRVDY